MLKFNSYIKVELIKHFLVSFFIYNNNYKISFKNNY